jgi:hypothetical protein
MRLPSHTITAAALLNVALLSVILLTLASPGCKTDTVLPPSPTALINNTRDRLTPFRFTLTTDPSTPSFNSPIVLKVHVIDAANQPADGVTLQADVSMGGMDQGAQHLTLSGGSDGDYQGEMKLDMAGSWDVVLTATKDGKSRQQRLSIEVGS